MRGGTSFRNRRDAGRQLATVLASTPLERPIVLALPRGGVPVGFEVAVALGAPLEVFVARKVGAPGREEFGIGAIAEGTGAAVMSDSAALVGVGPERFEQLVRREQAELRRRVEIYRGQRPLPQLDGRDVIVVDDGLATGVTAEAAILGVRALAPRRVVLAVPVAAPDSVVRLRTIADDVVTVLAPDGFMAVGSWYVDFTPTSDREVTELLGEARLQRPPDGV